MISIIIPAYNIGMYIYNCLDSIRKQIFRDYEVIVVNDGSSDNTLAILHDYKNNFPEFPLTIIDKVNGGVTAARRDGFMASQGEWICFVDGDDFMPETALYDLSSKISLGIDAVCGSYETFRDGDSAITTNHTKVPTGRYPCRDVIKFMLTNKFNSAPWAKLYNRNSIKLQMFDLSKDITNKEDTIFNYRFFSSASGDIVITNSIVYRYREFRVGSAFAKRYLSKKIDIDYELRVYNIIYNIVKSIKEYDKEYSLYLSISFYNLMWYCKKSLYDYKGNSIDEIEKVMKNIKLEYIEEDGKLKKYIKYYMLRFFVLCSKIRINIRNEQDYKVDDDE